MDYLFVGKLEFFKYYTWIYDTDQHEALNKTVFCGSHILTTKVKKQQIFVILSRRNSLLVI